MLEQWSRSMIARKNEKKEEKQERRGGKAARHAERRMRKLDRKKEEAVSDRDMARLARKEARVHRRFGKRSGRKGSHDKTSHEAKKFLWVVVEDLETGLARLKNAKYEAVATGQETGVSTTS